MLFGNEKNKMGTLKVHSRFHKNHRAVVHFGDALDLMKQIPDESIKLIITSPPYNIGKEYEKKLKLELYIEQQKKIIKECVRVLSKEGSLCWQVGNYVTNSAIIPLDIALNPVFTSFDLKMRNRIIWHFEHGLHCKKRFSGRYESIVWFTKSDDYTFHLDPVRVPQKYPQKKYFRGPKAGQFSCNPLGKNPGDLWIIPNVKNNHVEKTDHPCQFPVELIDRFVLSLTNKNDWVLDPFLGSGTSLLSALSHGRKGVGSEINKKYIEITYERIKQLEKGKLKTRPMNTPVYAPKKLNTSAKLKSKKEFPIEQANLFRVEKADFY